MLKDGTKEKQTEDERWHLLLKQMLEARPLIGLVRRLTIKRLERLRKSKS